MRSGIVILIYGLLVLPIAVIVSIAIPMLSLYEAYALTFWGMFALCIVPYMKYEDS